MSQNIGHVQRPAYYDELSSPLVLKRGAEEPKPAVSAVAPAQQVIQTLVPQVPTADEKQIELLYWNEVRDSKDIAALQSYVTQYPTGSFAPLAKIRIANLRKEQRRRQAAQKQKVAALTSTDTVIPLDDNRAIAVVPTDEPEPAPAPAVSTPAVPELSVRDIVLGVQKQLLRLGCNPGRPDGAWGPRSRRALQSYARFRKVRLAALEPTQELLNELNELDARVCPIQCGPRHKLSQGRCVRKTCRRGEVLTSQGNCVVRAERTRVKKKRERVRTKRRARVERRRKPRGQARIRVLGDPSLSVGVRRPSRRKRVCADRERALCEWDN